MATGLRSRAPQPAETETADAAEAAAPPPAAPQHVGGLGPNQGWFVPGRVDELPRVQFADSLVSLNDRCIIQKNRLSTLIRPVYVNRRPIAFCCVTCPAIFVQNPEPYLREQGIRLSCAVRPERPAVIAAETRVFLNHEIFYVHDRAAAEELRRNPTAFCGWLTDPVSGVRFRPSARSPRLQHRGRPFFFASDSTRATFGRSPDRYALRTGA